GSPSLVTHHISTSSGVASGDVTHATVDSEPLRRDPDPLAQYSSRGLQRFEAEVTSMEAKIDTAAQDLDAFRQGGPAMQTPTAITDARRVRKVRMHALLVTRADALEGLHRGLARGG